MHKELVRVGIDRPAAAATGSPADWLREGEPPRAFPRGTFAYLAEAHVGGGAVVLDVRRVSERAADGHVVGSVHIPVHQLRDRLSEIPDGTVWVHCAGGMRAAIAASLLDAVSTAGGGRGRRLRRGGRGRAASDQGDSRDRSTRGPHRWGPWPAHGPRHPGHRVARPSRRPTHGAAHGGFPPGRRSALLPRHPGDTGARDPHHPGGVPPVRRPPGAGRAPRRLRVDRCPRGMTALVLALLAGGVIGVSLGALGGGGVCSRCPRWSICSGSARPRRAPRVW